MTDPIELGTVYLGYFAPRTDLYSAWTETGWRPQRALLTPDVIVAGLQKRGPSISAYFPGHDSMTSVIALDIDREDGWELGRRVAKVMWAGGVPAYVDASRRGAHVWAPCLPSLPAVLVRRALRAFLADADAPDDPKIELRPATDRLSSAEGVGHALRLPLMPHGETGERHPLCWPDGRPLGGSLSEVLAAIADQDWPTEDAFTTAAERWAPPAEPERTFRDPEDRPRSIERFNDTVGVCEVLVADWGVANAVPGRAVRCPAHDDRNPSLSILRDDRRVVCHSPGCLFSNDGRGRDAYDLAQLAGQREVPAA